ncbi:MAG: hypothetical protein SOZ26_03775 [Bacteroidaceae bacterium]|nr:hypothetical protein [Bacteroidaceae bacterium]
MVTANRQNGTFKLRKYLWNGINKSFGGDTSKTITSVRCFEYKDGVQDLFINYSNSYSKRIKNVKIFLRHIIEEEIGDAVQFGHGELFILYDEKIYPFFYDLDDV